MHNSQNENMSANNLLIHEISSPEDDGSLNDKIFIDPTTITECSSTTPTDLNLAFTATSTRTQKQREIWFVIDELERRGQQPLINAEGITSYVISANEFHIKKKTTPQLIEKEYNYPIGSENNKKTLIYLEQWKQFMSSYATREIDILFVRAAQKIGLTNVQKREDLYHEWRHNLSYSTIQQVWHVLYGQFGQDEDIFKHMEMKLMAEYNLVYSYDSIVNKKKIQMTKARQPSKMGRCCIEHSFMWKKNCFVSAFNEKSNKHFGVTVTKSRSRDTSNQLQAYLPVKQEKGSFCPEYVKFDVNVIQNLPQHLKHVLCKMKKKQEKHMMLLQEEKKREKTDYLVGAQKEIEKRVSLTCFLVTQNTHHLFSWVHFRNNY